MLGLLRALWLYRGFVFGSVKREFQLKYKNSMLGAAWTVLNPLAMIVVYTVIFSSVMHAKLPGVDNGFAYSIYLCSGVLTWGLFAEILGRGKGIFFEHANTIKKINFPRFCLPVIVVSSALLNFFIIFSLFVIFLIISGSFPGIVFFAFFPVLLIQVLFSVGLAIIVGVLNVFFRDVGQFVDILLQFWFWLTPIVYPAAIIPDQIRSFMVYNPMMILISAYQGIFVNRVLPPWQPLFVLAVISIFLCFIALRLFRKRAGEMVDEL